MPTALAHAILDHFFILIRGRRGLALVSFSITEQTGSNNIALRRCSTLFVSFEMLAGTLETLRLAKRDLVF